MTWWHVEPDRIVIRDQSGEVASIPREVWGLLICAMAEEMRRQDARKQGPPGFVQSGP